MHIMRSFCLEIDLRFFSIGKVIEIMEKDTFSQREKNIEQNHKTEEDRLTKETENGWPGAKEQPGTKRKSGRMFKKAENYPPVKCSERSSMMPITNIH